MKNRRLLWLFIIFTAVLFIEFYVFNGRQSFLQDKEEASSPSPSFHQQKSLNVRQNNSLNVGPGGSKNRTPSSIISDEAFAISQLDEHPEQTEEKLKDIATSLEESELKKLKSKALGKNNNGDDRMLAAYLLSLSQHTSTASLLEQIALEPMDPTDSSADLEQVLRAQAIEGLQNRENKQQAIKSLTTLVAQLKIPMLLDHTQRALSYHLHGTPKVEEQDKKALEALVK